MRIPIGRSTEIVGHRPGHRKGPQPAEPESTLRRAVRHIEGLVPFKMRPTDGAGLGPPPPGIFLSESSIPDEVASAPGPAASSMLRKAEDDLLAEFGIVREDPTMRARRSIARSWGTDALGSVYAVACALGGDIEKMPTDPSRIYFVKTVSNELWKTAAGKMSNNFATKVTARVHDNNASIPMRPDGKVDFSMKAGQDFPMHGVAFKVTTNPFEQNLGPRGSPDHVAIHCTLKDVLESGEIYKRPNAVWENSVVVRLSRNEIPAATRL